MKNWMRVVLPPGSWIAVFILMYLVVVGFMWLTDFVGPQGWKNQFLFTARDGVVLFGAFVYGCFRSTYFHPACHSEYSDFLKQTAWTPEKPLPLGPVNLVWQDAVVLLFLLAAIWPEPFFHPLAPLFTMILGYFIGLLFVFQFCHVWKQLYILAFGCGTAVLFWSNPLGAFLILAALYVVACRGVKESLTETHRTMLREAISTNKIHLEPDKPFVQDIMKRLTGWPFDSLVARKPTFGFMRDRLTSIPRVHGILISLLVGWSVFSIAFMILQISEVDRNDSLSFLTDHVPTVGEVLQQELLHPGQSIVNEDSDFALMLLTIPGFFLSLFRLSSYCEGHYHPPINLWGRFQTFRWIIPEYDKVFISPIAILLVPAIFSPASYYIGISPLFTGPLMVTLMFLAALLIGPNRVEWQLTAPCRLARPPKYSKREPNAFVEL